MEQEKKNERYDDIYSRYVRAGKRTYFFDVKATKADDYYLTITESAKRFNDDGTFHFEKHRIFLYKEDFKKFIGRISEAMEFIVKEKGETPIRSVRTDSDNETRHVPSGDGLDTTGLPGAINTSSETSDSKKSELKEDVIARAEDAASKEKGDDVKSK